MKSLGLKNLLAVSKSPSLRRVWVEIICEDAGINVNRGHPPCGGCGLKFREIVDFVRTKGHPPCGGCGLKYSSSSLYDLFIHVTLLAEGVG